nr:hypothetical protein [Pseudomonas xionganensis]
MPRPLLTSCLLTLLLLAAGCQSASTLQPVPVACLPPPQPPAWMMQPEPEQTYTQQLQQVLSE